MRKSGSDRVGSQVVGLALLASGLTVRASHLVLLVAVVAFAALRCATTSAAAAAAAAPYGLLSSSPTRRRFAAAVPCYVVAEQGPVAIQPIHRPSILLLRLLAHHTRNWRAAPTKHACVQLSACRPTAASTTASCPNTDRLLPSAAAAAAAQPQSMRAT